MKKFIPHSTLLQRLLSILNYIYLPARFLSLNHFHYTINFLGVNMKKASVFLLFRLR